MSGQLLTFAQFRYLERKLQDTEKINEVGWPFPSPSERAMTDHVVGIAAREMLKYMENHSFPEFVDHLFRLSAQRIHPAAHDKATASIETLTSAMFDVSEKEPASQDSSPEEPSSPQKRARNEQSGAYGGAPSKIGSFIKSMTYADDNGPASNSELTSPSPTKFFKNPSRSHPPEIVKKHTDDPTDTQASQNRKTHPTDKKKSKSAGHKRRLSETAPDKNDKHDKKHKKRKSEPDPMDPDADH